MAHNKQQQPRASLFFVLWSHARAHVVVCLPRRRNNALSSQPASTPPPQSWGRTREMVKGEEGGTSPTEGGYVALASLFFIPPLFPFSWLCRPGIPLSFPLLFCSARTLFFALYVVLLYTTDTGREPGCFVTCTAVASWRLRIARRGEYCRAMSVGRHGKEGRGVGGILFPFLPSSLRTPSSYTLKQ